jgi:hypothetical protein
MHAEKRPQPQSQARSPRQVPQSVDTISLPSTAADKKPRPSVRHVAVLGYN